MSNYSNDPRMVRVDFFKESGKWYTTEAVMWAGDWETDNIRDSFITSLCRHLYDPKNKDGFRLKDMTAVCLTPYHKNAHPQMLVKWADYIEAKHA